jgi:hypothetical protein
MMFWNRSKHSSAQQGSPPPPIQILTHQPPRRPFSWRVTWKSDCSHFQEAHCLEFLSNCLEFLSNSLEFLSATVGRRPARGIAERISRLDCGEFLKLHQWQITANWVLNLPRLERWWGYLFSVPVYYLLEHSLSQFQMWTFHFALYATFSSGFWYGLYHTDLYCSVWVCTFSPKYVLSTYFFPQVRTEYVLGKIVWTEYVLSTESMIKVRTLGEKYKLS